MMASSAPYRLQIFLDPAMRKALREAAHQEETSMQQLVTYWLFEKLKDHPAGKHLRLPEQP